MVISNLKFFIGGYSGVNFGHLKSQVFHFGGYFGVNFSHLKSEAFHWEGAFWSEIPERGFLENLDKNLLCEECVQKPACASQIVSHILLMWRLTNGNFCIALVY